MVVIFDKDIFIKYLKSFEPKGKKNEIFTLIKIFENENNKIAITNELIKRIEDQINSSPSLLNLFQQFMKDIIDSKRFIKCKSDPDEIQDIIETYNSIDLAENKFILIDKKHNQLNNFENYINYTCLYSNIKKTNKCWLIFNLLSGDSVTVRYSDFDNNKQIELFFETIFNLIKQKDEIFILDSYCNVHRHILFDTLKTKGSKILVYSSSAIKSRAEILQLNSEIKKYFGKNRTSVRFSSDKKLIHERTLTFRDIVIESNHDFAEVNRANQNWKLDVTINSDLKLEIEKKCSAYNPPS